MIAILVPIALIGLVLAMGGSRASAPAPVSALDTFNAYLRQGQEPPSFVAKLAHDEALSIGDAALAQQIAATFLAPSATASGSPTLPPMTSPIPGVADEPWNAFASVLAREPVDHDSNRRIGRYAASKSRLTEIGIDPTSIANSSNAQDVALCADLADAHHHLAQSGELGKWIGHQIAIPDSDDVLVLSLSGLLGVCSVAGLEGAIGWLRSKDERKRFPNTTNLFLRTNGIF